MKANDILNKIKNIVGVELSEEKVELAQISLKNGTLLVSKNLPKAMQYLSNQKMEKWHYQ